MEKTTDVRESKRDAAEKERVESSSDQPKVDNKGKEKTSVGRKIFSSKVEQPKERVLNRPLVDYDR